MKTQSTRATRHVLCTAYAVEKLPRSNRTSRDLKFGDFWIHCRKLCHLVPLSNSHSPVSVPTSLLPCPKRLKRTPPILQLHHPEGHVGEGGLPDRTNWVFSGPASAGKKARKATCKQALTLRQFLEPRLTILLFSTKRQPQMYIIDMVSDHRSDQSNISLRIVSSLVLG